MARSVLSVYVLVALIYFVYAVAWRGFMTRHALGAALIWPILLFDDLSRLLRGHTRH